MPHTFFESVVFKALNNDPICELADVTCPWPAPKPVRKTGNKVTKMRNGADGPGFRIVKMSGAGIGDYDLHLDVLFMDDSQHAAIKLLEESDEAFKVSLDSGATFYRAVLQDDGYIPKPWAEDFYKEGAQINIHILGVFE